MTAAPPPLALAYHGVSRQPLAADPHRLFVSPDDLTSHVTWLRAHGYRLVSFSRWAELVAARAAAGHATLTFDDGFADNETTLLPLLRHLDAPATVFVVPGLLGKPHPDVPSTRLADADAVVRLADAGVEIGSHTMRHRDLTELSPTDAETDLSSSRHQLQELTGQPVDVLAYPFGRADDQTRAAARTAGYVAACRTAGDGTLDDPWDLPRQAMGNRSSLTGLRLKARGWYEPVMSTLPGRVVRRARLSTHQRLPTRDR